MRTPYWQVCTCSLQGEYIVFTWIGFTISLESNWIYNCLFFVFYTFIFYRPYVFPSVSLPSPVFFLPFLIITSQEEACNEGRSWSGLSTTQLSPLLVNSVPLQATNFAFRVGTCLQIVEPFKHLFCATVHFKFWCLSCEHPWALARDNMVFPLWVCMG